MFLLYIGFNVGAPIYASFLGQDFSYTAKLSLEFNLGELLRRPVLYRSNQSFLPCMLWISSKSGRGEQCEIRKGTCTENVEGAKLQHTNAHGVKISAVW